MRVSSCSYHSYKSNTRHRYEVSGAQRCVFCLPALPLSPLSPPGFLFMQPSGPDLTGWLDGIRLPRDRRQGHVAMIWEGKKHWMLSMWMDLCNMQKDEWAANRSVSPPLCLFVSSTLKSTSVPQFLGVQMSFLFIADQDQEVAKSFTNAGIYYLVFEQ